MLSPDLIGTIAATLTTLSFLPQAAPSHNGSSHGRNTRQACIAPLPLASRYGSFMVSRLAQSRLLWPIQLPSASPCVFSQSS